MPQQKQPDKIFGLTPGELLLGGVVVGFGIYQVKNFIDKGAGTLGVNTDENNTAGTKLSAWSSHFYLTAPSNAPLLPQDIIEGLAGDIHQYPGIFWDSFGTVQSVLKQLRSKAQVSQLSAAFAEEYDYDLYTYLVDGGGFLPADGLSNDHLTQVNNYVKNLPDYYY